MVKKYVEKPEEKVEYVAFDAPQPMRSVGDGASAGLKAVDPGGWRSQQLVRIGQIQKEMALLVTQFDVLQSTDMITENIAKIQALVDELSAIVAELA